MKTMQREPVRSISRAEAAQLLRIARGAFRTDPASAGEAIGWALTMLRDSHQARRLKVDYLIQIRNFDSADALLARCMMTDIERPLLRLRFARSMFEQGRIAQADREIRLVLETRPQHCGALQLGASIAACLDDQPRAIELLLAASSRRPANLSIRLQLVQALLNQGYVDRAAQILDHWPKAPCEMVACVLRSQGRFLDALAALRSACQRLPGPEADPPTGDQFNRNGRLLIELLDECGAIDELMDWTARFADAGQDSALDGAEALLGYGRFDAALGILATLSPMQNLKNRTVRLQTIALALMGNMDAAHASLEQFDMHDPLNVPQLARTWLRGLAGRMIVENSDARAAGADPSTSVLQPMLANAADVLQRAVTDDRTGAGENCDRLPELLATCLLAMGQSDRCAAALAHSIPNRSHVLAA